MKRIWCLMLVILLCLSGCRTAGPGETETTAAAQTETTATGAETTAPAEETTQGTEATEIEQTVPETSGQSGEETDMAFTNQGRLRIEYRGNRSSVQYITDPAQLPDHEELKQYDADYFKDHALILVVDTVNSGSVQIEIGSIAVKGTVASVTLSRKMDGEGTADMATWLLWAEVEAGLEYEWEVANAALAPSGELY